MTKSARLALLLVLMAVTSPLLAQTTILLDTFDDDPVGGFPQNPEIGDSDYYGSGTRTVTADFGGRRLRCVDETTDGGFANQWWPTIEPAMFEVSYLYRLESATGAGYHTTQTVTLYTDDSAETAVLTWQPDGSWGLLGELTATAYSLDTDYRMVWHIDCSTDRISVWADDMPLFSDRPLGFDCTTLHSFSQASTFPNTTSEVIDEVWIIDGQTVFADGFEGGDSGRWMTGPSP